MISRVPSYEVSSDDGTSESHESTPLLSVKSRKTSNALHIFLICFAATSNLGCTAILVELPLILGTAPEGWSLSTWCTVAVQCANLFAIVYFAIDNWVVDLKETPINIICLIAGMAASLAMAEYYGFLVVIWYEPRSFTVLFSMFIFAIVGCMSALTSLPYVGRFSEACMKSYLIGEGLSSLIPAGIAFIQGMDTSVECRKSNVTDYGYEFVAPPARFSIEAYFYLICGVFFVGLVAFVLLSKFYKHHYEAVIIDRGNYYLYAHHRGAETEMGIFNKEGIYIFGLLASLYIFSSGVLPSFQSYSSLPYGAYTYHLVAVLTAFTGPLTLLISYYIPLYSTRAIVHLSIIVLIVDAYVVATAMLPVPPFVGTIHGQILVISCWIISGSLHNFIRLACVLVLRKMGERSLVWSGIATQFGSLIGAIVSFFLVSYSNLFQDRNQCVGL